MQELLYRDWIWSRVDVEKTELAVIEWGAHENAGIAEKGMDIVENEYTKAIVSEEILGQVDEIRQKIASGEIEVKSAMTMSPEELNQIKDSAGN